MIITKRQETIRRLGLFANVNLYATLPGAAVAVPPHNDRQDVFVLQAARHNHKQQ